VSNCRRRIQRIVAPIEISRRPTVSVFSISMSLSPLSRNSTKPFPHPMRRKCRAHRAPLSLINSVSLHSVFRGRCANAWRVFARLVPRQSCPTIDQFSRSVRLYPVRFYRKPRGNLTEKQRRNVQLHSVARS